MTSQELVKTWQQWCVDNQCDVNPFCTSATKKLVEMVEDSVAENSCQCNELKEMIVNAKDDLKETMRLLSLDTEKLVLPTFDSPEYNSEEWHKLSPYQMGYKRGFDLAIEKTINLNPKLLTFTNSSQSSSKPCYCNETHMHNCPAHTHLQDELISNDTNKTPISSDIGFEEWLKSSRWGNNLDVNLFIGKNVLGECWYTSRYSTLKEILGALPELRMGYDKQVGYYSEGEVSGYNDCLDEIRAIIEKKMESGK